MTTIVAQQAGVVAKATLPHLHNWQTGREFSWLVCAGCGLTALCKGCQAEWQGSEMVKHLPNVFCPAHQYQADYFQHFPMQHADIAGRLVYLASSIPSALWVVDGMPVSQSQEMAHVALSGCALHVTHSCKVNYWRVLVGVPDGSSAPVFHADGPSADLHVHFCQPGAWVNTLLSAVSLRDALPIQEG